MKVLLHICCGVCAGSCLQSLRAEGHQVSGYFYNPNIQPPEEYLNRLQAAKTLARREGFPLIVGDFDADEWFFQIKGLEQEPEGGRRCLSCFTVRLQKTATVAQARGFEAFTTTLTVSPHKDSRVINEIGQNAGKGLFLPRDFKKQDGFKKAQQLAKQYNLYHQDYCGCLYSKNKKGAWPLFMERKRWTAIQRNMLKQV